MSGMLTREELEAAVARILEIQLPEAPKDAGKLREDMIRIYQQASMRERFWASVWQLYKVNERDVIQKYVKAKDNFQQFHEMMRNRLDSGRIKLSENDLSVLRDMDQLLKVDPAFLNSVHVLWILRAIRFLRKRKEPSQSSSGSGSGGSNNSSNHRNNNKGFQYGFLLITLIQVTLLAESNQPQDAVIGGLEQWKGDLQNWLNKAKRFFDETSILRVECAIAILTQYLARLQSGAGASTSGLVWSRRWAPMVMDLIRNEISFLKAKFHHDKAQYQANLGLDYFTPEKRGPIEAFLNKLTAAESNLANVTILLPKLSSSSSAADIGATYFAGTSYGGSVSL